MPAEPRRECAMEGAPMDFEVHDHGSLWIIIPRSEAAIVWADEHLPEDALTWGAGVVVEPRYVPAILEGIMADGLSIGHGYDLGPEGPMQDTLEPKSVLSP
jgi:hypothetical protein